ncbi:MAG: hypothetical protein AAGF29_06010, partial [Pseudomonadota bacterium]
LRAERRTPQAKRQHSGGEQGSVATAAMLCLSMEGLRGLRSWYRGWVPTCRLRDTCAAGSSGAKGDALLRR